MISWKLVLVIAVNVAWIAAAIGFCAAALFRASGPPEDDAPGEVKTFDITGAHLEHDRDNKKPSLKIVNAREVKS